MAGMRPALKIKVELYGEQMRKLEWAEQVEEIQEMLLDAVDLMRQGYKEGQARDSQGKTALWFEIGDTGGALFEERGRRR